MREEKGCHISSRLKERRLVVLSEKDVLATDRPAAAPARRLHLHCPPGLAVLGGSAAGVAPAEDRGPAGEELDGRGDGGRLRLRGQRVGGGGGGGDRARSPEELPVHRHTHGRARAGRREATPVGREAATPATDGAFRTMHEGKGSHHLHYNRGMQESRMMRSRMEGVQRGGGEEERSRFK